MGEHIEIYLHFRQLGNWLLKKIIFRHKLDIVIEDRRIDGNSQLYLDMENWINANLPKLSCQVLASRYHMTKSYDIESVDSFYFRRKVDLIAFKLVFHEYLLCN